jgi:sigma-B regulation protein RsbU (phosphoserine phosphatase)
LLKETLEELCNKKDYEISGGRIWKLNREKKRFDLVYQYGNVNKIPDDYSVSFDESKAMDAMKELYQKRILVDEEEDSVLKKSGIFKYSLSGLGELVSTPSGKFYEFAIGLNADEFNFDTFETIKVLSSVTTVALRNFDTKDHRSKIEREYEKARKIQENILPNHFEEFLDYEVFGVCLPDSAVGGDYFDFIRTTDKHNNEETLSIVISDAASKGLSAAIQALFVSGAIRMGMSLGSRITHIFGVLNKLINKTFPQERFVTLFMCELTRSQNRMVLYANAGHCSPIHYRAELDNFVDLNPTGGLLGIDENQKFGLENVRMHFDDVLCLFTDGISEAQNSEGKLFGEDRIKEVIRDNKELSARDLTYVLLEEVNKYSVDSNYTDDQTIVMIKRNKKS